jgi:LasA protease
MDGRITNPKPRLYFLAIMILTGAALACARSIQPNDSPSWQVPGQGAVQAAVVSTATRTPFHPPTRVPGAPILTPTADVPHPLPSLRTEPEQYVVQAGDTLGIIAQRYGIGLEEVLEANKLLNPNLLAVGQMLTIPVPTPQGPGPDFKVIPDSELVYGPLSAYFDVEAFIQSQGGYLARYEEEIGEDTLNGAQIVEQVAQNFSVNPRLLLAVLEYQSGWVTDSEIGDGENDFPIGIRDYWREGLYSQLAWAANNLNRGYYLWRVNGVGTWVLGDGSVVPIDPTINAGTAGIQSMFAPLYDRASWEEAVSEGGLFATYNNLFGYPFDLAIEPLLPLGLRQPKMQLPFEQNVEWSFTGGPHGGWGDGSAWAALDFAPPADALGCIPSDAWITAITDGLITRAADGAVIQDLDGDGLEVTGWVVLYMHVESKDRIEVGTYVEAGERIGHPSCEGGISSGTHVHIARKYNGEWIPADQTMPFVLDNWVSRGTGEEYDGYLERNGQSIEAWEGRSPDNAIQR